MTEWVLKTLGDIGGKHLLTPRVLPRWPLIDAVIQYTDYKAARLGASHVLNIKGLVAAPVAFTFNNSPEYIYIKENDIWTVNSYT